MIFNFLVFPLMGALANAAPANAPKGVMHIQGIGDDRVVIRAEREVYLKKNQRILFVRHNNEEDEDETIASGTVKTSKDGKVLVMLDMDSLKKRPEKTDNAVLLGNPKLFQPPGNPPKPIDHDLETAAEEIPEPGYIQLQMRNFTGALTTDTPNAANSFKNMTKYPTSGFELEWFLDFLSHYGIAYGQRSGAVPITSYYRENVDGTVAETDFKLMYRTERHSSMRGIFELQSLSTNFTTTNPDEFILATSLRATMLGASFVYEPGDLLLKGENKSRMQFTYLKLRAATSFSIEGSDGTVSRGSLGAGSSITELNASMSGTFYLNWVPWVKRYILTIEGYSRDQKMAFTGATKSQGAGGIYTIPQNQTYGERESGFMVGIGVRFDDVVGRVFRPKH